MAHESWGRFPRLGESQHPVALEWPWDNPFVELPADRKVLPYGRGRSYGDSCLNAGGGLLLTERWNRCVAFDERTGVLRCESGVTLADIIQTFLPRGWFLPVTPGTKFVSVGGAIANDVHGKNHHVAGTFGCHVRQFELLRSDGQRLLCSPTSNRDLFCATIGGLGLTGLITWAEIQLKPAASAFIDQESVKFQNLDEFFEVSASTPPELEYTVAWLDCVASGPNFGRGIFMRGRHSTKTGRYPPKLPLVVPVDFPSFALNALSVRAFNFLYYGKQRSRSVSSTIHYDPFFYPLDAVHHWNRIYGRRGFLQFQCVVPSTDNNRAIREILQTIVQSGQASFLAVLKEFGSVPSPGMLSFPRPGVTLALDFAYQGSRTLDLFSRLDSYVCEVGGALYPAKDACMGSKTFQCYYPRWQEFSRHIDPRFSSSFWRRVMGEGKT